jgi:transposase
VQTAIAAAILRHLHVVITTGTAWDPVIATHGTGRKETTTLAA